MKLETFAIFCKKPSNIFGVRIIFAEALQSSFQFLERQVTWTEYRGKAVLEDEGMQLKAL